MRRAEVYRNGELVGILTQHHPKHYSFTYDDVWFANEKHPPVSLTLPKADKVHEADHLFPFFFNMISEGVNRQLQARQLKIDEKDYFGLLMATGSVDTIGAITIQPIIEGNS